MGDTSDPDAKVLFRIPSEESDEAHVETLWAWSLGNDRYKLDNLPYFAYSVSTDDIVLAPFDEDEGFPTFQKVVEKSGNRTIRIIFDESADAQQAAQDILDQFLEMGCSYEGANRRYIAVNVPPESNFDLVAKLLIESETEFEYADPTYSVLFPDDH